MRSRAISPVEAPESDLRTSRHNSGPQNEHEPAQQKKILESVVYLYEYPPVLPHDRYPFFQQGDWLF